MEAVLNMLAALALIAFGLYSLLQPRASAKFAHLTADTSKGVAEIRVAFGALSLAMGAIPLVINQPLVWQAFGIVWLVAVAVRVLAFTLDRPKLDRGFLLTGAFELIVGLIMVL